MGFDVQPDTWEVRPAGRTMSLHGLREALVVLFCVIAALSAVRLAVYLLGSIVVGRILDDLDRGRPLGRYAERAWLLDGLELAGVVAWCVVALATAPVFIAWQYRHASNARLLGASGRLGPEWAIGGWFVPVGNLVLPALQLHGASRYSDPRRRADGSIGQWWMFSLAGMAFFLAAVLVNPRDAQGAEYLSQVREFDWLAAIATGCNVWAAVLALVMVRRLSDRQEVALYGTPVAR